MTTTTTEAKNSAMDEIVLRRPDDWHLHLRDGVMLETVVPYTARQFARAIIMPNLVPPVTTVEAATAYRERILAALPTGSDFEPLMTAYLTDSIAADEIERGWKDGPFKAVKMYPAHATTNSEFGVTDIAAVYPVLERMQALGTPLLVHGEVVDSAVDVFDREAVFIDRVLRPLLADMPGLKVVFEHVTTEDAVAFVSENEHNVGATITAQHLVINRNALFEGGLRPHMYCLPVAKREKHRLALRRAATSGDARFFLGTDSAPHPASAKETDCGCAGCFTAATALEIYAQVFDEEGALDRFEAFAALNGARFYGLPVNDGTIKLTRQPTPVPERIAVGHDHLVPFFAGASVNWRVVTG
jgi:dihydroorotase